MCRAKTRYRQADQRCAVQLSADCSRASVRFANPQRAVTPGQSVVFYDAAVCLGGGIIETVEGAGARSAALVFDSQEQAG